MSHKTKVLWENIWSEILTKYEPFCLDLQMDLCVGELHAALHKRSKRGRDAKEEQQDRAVIKSRVFVVCRDCGDPLGEAQKACSSCNHTFCEDCAPSQVAVLAELYVAAKCDVCSGFTCSECLLACEDHSPRAADWRVICAACNSKQEPNLQLQSVGGRMLCNEHRKAE